MHLVKWFHASAGGWSATLFPDSEFSLSGEGFRSKNGPPDVRNERRNMWTLLPKGGVYVSTVFWKSSQLVTRLISVKSSLFGKGDSINGVSTSRVQEQA